MKITLLFAIGILATGCEVHWKFGTEYQALVQPAD